MFYIFFSFALCSMWFTEHGIDVNMLHRKSVHKSCWHGGVHWQLYYLDIDNIKTKKENTKRNLK